MVDQERIRLLIMRCDDPAKLKQWIKNLRVEGEPDLAAIAFRRLISIVPGETPGSLEHDFWISIQAFEELKSQAAGATRRLNYTRRMVKTKGVRETLKGWALGSATEGFDGLLELGMPELTGEAIVLRHSGEFEPEVVQAARARLVAAQVDVDMILPPSRSSSNSRG